MHFLDFRSGERRPGLYRDHVDMLRVFERMPMGNIVWTHSVEDAPDHRLATVRMSLDTLKHSSKHLQDELLFPEEVPFLVEGLEALLGSEAEVRRRKIYSVCYCTIPPLTHDKHMCEAYLELGRYEVPILLPRPVSDGQSGLPDHLRGRQPGNRFPGWMWRRVWGPWKTATPWLWSR